MYARAPLTALLSPHAPSLSQTLTLSDNRFSSYPDFAPFPIYTKNLYLNNNHFRGPVPWTLFPVQLVQLWLQGNSFSGCVTTDKLQDLTYLTGLYLDDIALNCSLTPAPNLPASLKNLSLVSERGSCSGRGARAEVHSPDGQVQLQVLGSD